MWNHIRENAKTKDIYIDAINGYSDHCHCLISLGKDQTLQKVMQLVKGESSFWFNKQKLINYKFEWQNEYFALSVSRSVIDKTRSYIANQEVHHFKQTFNNEVGELIEKYGFQKFDD